MSLLDDLPHRCTIGRQYRASDGLGGSRYQCVIEQVDVPCWEQQASASEIKEFEKRGITVTTKVYFSSDPGLTEQHRILITEKNGRVLPASDITDVANPDTFDVMSSTYPDAGAGLGILYKAMCKNNSGGTQ